MIKFLELTAPESSEFRQAKIISIEVAEGDEIKVGDTLFKVRSGENDFDLPTTKNGKITELIVSEGENISIMTPLLLLETEVEGSTATRPIMDDADSDKPKKALSKKAKKKKSKKKVKKKSKKKASSKTSSKKSQLKSDESDTHQQQSLNLAEESNLETPTQTTQNHSQVDNIMSSNKETNKIAVPDIGGDSAKVIEIHVKVGESVDVDDPIITLESDKASMDVPCPQSGVVESIIAQLDQEMSEGDPILELTQSEGQLVIADDAPASTGSTTQADTSTPPSASSTAENVTSSVEVTIPDIGGDSAKVIEILVNVGQEVSVEDPLVTLESDKASMDVPSSAAGIVESIELNLDQDVSEGMVVVKLSSLAESGPVDSGAAAPVSTKSTASAPEKAEQPAKTASSPSATAQTPSPGAPSSPAGKSHASPSIRRFARELGVDLSKLTGSGRKGRISKPDVKQYVKSVMSSTPASTPQGGQVHSGGAIPQIPAVDFSKFGEIEIQPLNRIKKLTATNLHRSWLNVPHVTHHDESNINDLESFRKQLNAEYAKQNKPIKLSPLAFIVKAVVNALQTYPQFNSSLDPDGENLILKKYVNIGIAVETPNGLVVPVVKDADKLSVGEIATAMGELAAKARDKKLTTRDMTGAGFTISSLGGIGGTSFTPIVNAPEVAILGVSRSKINPVWDGSSFQPGTVLPLSLSYDHRVIDGAEAARFTRHIAAVLEDVRRLAV